MKLGKLKEVDIRTVWAHEQYDFSKWLASEENIKELSDTLGLSLTNIETEKFVGSYRCDILCQDELTGKNVLIENQLESTNHDHLGKLITYASGLDASVVIWIVKEAKAEYSSAIEWLNKHTDDDLSFFLIEIHAYTIGDSQPAPQFKIIEQPNDFSKQVKNITKGGGKLNESQTCRLEFWNMFNDILESRGRPFNKHKASTDSWYSIAVGTSSSKLLIDLVNREHIIRIGLWTNSKDIFDNLYLSKDKIETELGLELDWDRLDNKKSAVICCNIDGLDFKNQENYPELINKAIDMAIAFKKVFSKYL